MNTMTFLLRPAITLFAPIFQMVFLRFFFHSVLNLRIGFPGFTDYELLFPAPLGFLAFFMALDQEKKIKLSFRLQGLILNSICFSLFVAFAFFSSSIPESVFQLIWWLMLGATFTSSFFIWIEPKLVFQNKNFWTIIPSLLMVLSLVIYLNWGNVIWSSAIKYMEWGVRKVLALTGNELIRAYAGRRFLQLQHPLWAVHVGQGCGGFDSLLLFSSAFSIFATLVGKEIRKTVLLWSWFLGFVFFGCLNIFRIILIFTWGIYSIQHFGRAEGIRWTLGLFHVHSGYLLYTLGLATYFLILTSVFARYRRTAKAAKRPVLVKTSHNQARLP